MEIVLVRHALPVRVDATPDGGPADPGLSERGFEQAARLADLFASDDVTALYTSPSRRASETAAVLEQALGVDAVVEPGVAEFDQADTSYVPVEELKASGDPRWELLVRGELYSVGVDPAAFRSGVVAALDAVAARHPGGRAVLVTHAGAINVAAGQVLGQPRTLWFAPAYCSLTRLAFARDGRRGVVSLNETGHVRDLLDR